MTAYHAAVYGSKAALSGSFDVALDACRLHPTMQWLGWSADWSPPPEHRQDWLAHAMELAERLGL